MNKKNGRLIIVSGISGAGKGTICRALVKKYPEEYALSVSATTRAPRKGEVNGVHYFFMSQEEFDKTANEGGFLEFASYVGHSYGTPKKWVEDTMQSGRDVILEIEVQGAMQVKELMPDAVTVFILPPNEEELIKRFKSRGTESEEEIKKRMARGEEEATYIPKYDYVITNVTVDKSVEMLHNI